MGKCQLTSNNQQPIRYLITAYQANRLHHAFLFTGIEDPGKFDAAIQFAMFCNCLNKSALSQVLVSCRECQSCRKILTQQHPDMIIIKPDGASIKIAQIRLLRKKLSYKPVVANVRFVIMVQAHLMTIESANALLKILEEPPDRTVFTLIVENQKDVLQTIASRCQQIRFSPCSENTMVSHLLKNTETPRETALVLARLSSGSWMVADFFQKPKWQHKRTYLFSRLEKLDQLSIGMRLSLAEQLSRNKDDLSLILEILMTWFRDILVYRYCPERIINLDYQASIFKYAQKWTPLSVIKKIEQIQHVQKDLLSNVNKRLAFERLILIYL